MKSPQLGLLTMLLALVGLAGCGGAQSGEDVAREQINAMNEMAALLEGITSDASADAAMPKLKAAAERVRRANQRAEATARPVADARAPDQQTVKEMIDAGLRLAQAALKAQLAARGRAEQIKAVCDKADPETK